MSPDRVLKKPKLSLLDRIAWWLIRLFSKHTLSGRASAAFMSKEAFSERALVCNGQWLQIGHHHMIARWETTETKCSCGCELGVDRVVIYRVTNDPELSWQDRNSSETCYGLIAWSAHLGGYPVRYV